MCVVRCSPPAPAWSAPHTSHSRPAELLLQTHIHAVFVTYYQTSFCPVDAGSSQNLPTESLPSSSTLVLNLVVCFCNQSWVQVGAFFSRWFISALDSHVPKPPQGRRQQYVLKNTPLVCLFLFSGGLHDNCYSCLWSGGPTDPPSAAAEPSLPLCMASRSILPSFATLFLSHI